jgi:hypothetical protein
MTSTEKIIYRCLVYRCHGTGLYISEEALKLYYGEDYKCKYSGIRHNDPIRTDLKFYDVIRQLGIHKTFNKFEYDIAFKDGCCPIQLVEFYTESQPNIIPYELWFEPVIHEYDGSESVKQVHMLTPQIEFMKKIQQNQELTSHQRCLKYEEILLLEPPVIKYRYVELSQIFDY